MNTVLIALIAGQSWKAVFSTCNLKPLAFSPAPKIPRLSFYGRIIQKENQNDFLARIKLNGEKTNVYNYKTKTILFFIFFRTRIRDYVQNSPE